MRPHGTHNFKPKSVYQNHIAPLKEAAFKCDPVRTYIFDIDKNTFEKVIWYLNI